MGKIRSEKGIVTIEMSLEEALLLPFDRLASNTLGGVVGGAARKLLAEKAPHLSPGNVTRVEGSGTIKIILYGEIDEVE